MLLFSLFCFMFILPATLALLFQTVMVLWQNDGRINLTLTNSENGELDEWESPGNWVTCCSFTGGSAGLWGEGELHKCCWGRNQGLLLTNVKIKWKIGFKFLFFGFLKVTVRVHHFFFFLSLICKKNIIETENKFYYTINTALLTSLDHCGHNTIIMHTWA